MKHSSPRVDDQVISDGLEITLEDTYSVTFDLLNDLHDPLAAGFTARKFLAVFPFRTSVPCCQNEFNDVLQHNISRELRLV